ncbi:uncharacterized protein PV09_06879 [Verruconis gallopava]|uniref:NmrA-like domain-containing protein n=1 Tax=Verruconis gallopava TaxID=253628 RepID=A0A0D2A597_9PEZI|nr:uncharacterized protein PV09_06879 [Verruconis gallopava]KIW01700.1 hypothetical protein PV09_06879 [Verruconis gallopava]
MASPTPPPKVFVIGGTGAQGRPVIRGLVRDGAYAVRVLTRDASSKYARQLKALSPSLVELVEGTFADETALRNGLRGCAYAFVNIDGFNCGEKAEVYWAIRTYELAVESGLRFFVYGNLDYGLKKGQWASKYRCGHYDGKGRVGEWILQQNRQLGRRMGAALFTTGPYIEMTIAKDTPMCPTIENGVVTWRMPLSDGAVPFVALEDCEYYVRWIFDHQDQANGMDLEVAVDHIGVAELAAAFAKVTGRPAVYVPVSLDEYWTDGVFASRADRVSGYNSDRADAAHMLVRDNFTGFWNLWRDSGGNKGVVRRDYALLDRIHPGRIRSAEEWFAREEKRGREQGLGGLWDRVNAMKPVLKDVEDGRRGRL